MRTAWSASLSWKYNRCQRHHLAAHFSYAAIQPCENSVDGGIGACPSSGFQRIQYVSIGDGTPNEINAKPYCSASSTKVIVELSDDSFHDRHILGEVPCILMNMTTGWPAMKHDKWSFKMLLRTYKDTHFLYNNWFGTDQKLTEANRCSTRRVKFENLQSELNVIKLSTFLDEIQNLTIDDGETLSSSGISNYKRYSPNLPYIFDSSFSAGQSKALLDDYTAPPIFSDRNNILGLLSSHLTINFRWFLLGPRNSGSSLHVDPKHTSAWNALVVGRKWWVLISPDAETSDLTESAHQIQSSAVKDNTYPVECTDIDNTAAAVVVGLIRDNSAGGAKNATSQVTNIPFWFHDTLPEIVERNKHLLVNKKTIYSFIQEEGETVFVPAGWKHAVLNLESSVAITHNFVSRNNKTLFLAWISDNLDELGMSEEEYRECVITLEESN